MKCSSASVCNYYKECNEFVNKSGTKNKKSKKIDGWHYWETNLHCARNITNREYEIKRFYKLINLSFFFFSPSVLTTKILLELWSSTHFLRPKLQPLMVVRCIQQGLWTRVFLGSEWNSQSRCLVLCQWWALNSVWQRSYMKINECTSVCFWFTSYKRLEMWSSGQEFLLWSLWCSLEYFYFAQGLFLPSFQCLSLQPEVVIVPFRIVSFITFRD